MDLRKIKKLIELAEESGITELEVRSGDEAVRIVRPGAARQEAAMAAAAPASSRQAAPAPAQVLAPMAGTYYAAPEPGAAPFVQVGQSLAAGDVVCIIESMKMMNEIRVDRDAVVGRVLVANGTAVAAGQALIQLD